MAEGDDEDDLSKARGNTDHDPKPEDQARRNVLPRGLAATPAPSPGGFGTSGGYRQPRRPPGPNDMLMGASRRQPAGDRPIAPKEDLSGPAPQFKRGSGFDLPDDMEPEQRRAIEERVKAKLEEIQQQRKQAPKL